MAYLPSAVPTDASALPTYLANELQRLSRELQSTVPFVLLDTLYAAPKKLRDGLVVKADGTTWDPGSGAGVYCYRGAAWHFLG